MFVILRPIKNVNIRILYVNVDSGLTLLSHRIICALVLDIKNQVMRAEYWKKVLEIKIMP